MRRILIVDDEYSIRELYRYVFMDLGYKVETAKDGRDGLEKVRVFNPDLMLIDIAMPGMTGMELAKELQNDPAGELRNIPFIVLTGENSMDVSIQYAFQGNQSCKAFLPKMTSPESVARMAQKILGAGG